VIIGAILCAVGLQGVHAIQIRRFAASFLTLTNRAAEQGNPDSAVGAGMG
jgi:hypothetical protein